MAKPFGLLTFHEQYFERIWGGQRLRTLFDKPIPPDRPIGEAWLISDHPSAVSVVKQGPHAGRTLHDLVEQDADALLGSASKLTPHGRFPLLLKLLDSTDVLSVQVHPDDATAARLGEPDVGKTEMWHILHADEGAKIICGTVPGTSPDAFKEAISAGRLDEHLVSIDVHSGDSIMVDAGTVHAIGAGIVLAEIQQNSDLTYRLYDWSRVDSSGNPRSLHIEKGLIATKFQLEPRILRKTSGKEEISCRESLVSSRFFNSELLHLSGEIQHDNSEQFSIVLSTHQGCVVSSETERTVLNAGDSVLVPACIKKITVEGQGRAVLYSA